MVGVQSISLATRRWQPRSYRPHLQSYASLFANMAIYKIPDPDQSKNGPNDIS